MRSLRTLPGVLTCVRASVGTLLVLQVGLDLWVGRTFVRGTKPFDPNRQAWSTENAGTAVLRTHRTTGQMEAWIAQENRWVTLGGDRLSRVP
jgi:hypothetical protein